MTIRFRHTYVHPPKQHTTTFLRKEWNGCRFIAYLIASLWHELGITILDDAQHFDRGPYRISETRPYFESISDHTKQIQYSILFSSKVEPDEQNKQQQNLI
ncbi:Hypothetical_protein [Hexamita inflata]|uniref:Hypothetical_protein n=1 Tax=Hexamita inflata TaxID=28002 RepID=A0AA86RT31_9EUKA|nr:Hypothetical protein HINF_LOCUS65257 [Hexamita inflata]